MRKLSAATELPPPLELECLKALWLLGDANVKQVQDSLAKDRQLAYTTVMTVLERLVRRNCVGRRKVGRSFVYAASLSRENVRRLAVKDLVDTFFDGDAETLREYLATHPVPAAAAAAAAANGTAVTADGEARLEPALL